MKIDSDTHKQHISQKFNEELESIRTQILEMGGIVEQQVQQAIESVVSADSAQARLVCKGDDQVNQMEIDIDETCVKILAKRQPTASDLRLVFSITKVLTDLERIGDEASKIAMQAIELCEEGQAPKGYTEIRHIGELVRKMLRQSLDAFARLDTEDALLVVNQDKEVDREYATAMRELATYMMEDPRSIKRVMSIVWTLRSLERVGDHARNIAEYVIYLVNGKDVRHISYAEMREKLD